MGLIGENPHPLVSARSPLRGVLFAELRSGLPYPTLGSLGFPEFTRCFTTGYPAVLLFPRESLDGLFTRSPQPHALPLSYRGMKHYIRRCI